MHDAVVGLGSNLGASAALLEAAIALLEGTPGLTLRARSRLYRTPPLGPVQPDFHNAAVRVSWVGTPHGLLDVLLFTEARLGRERRERWGPRTVDLDLLWWSGAPVQSVRLSVPHPGLTQRSFALAPLLDVLPEKSATFGPALELAGGRPPCTPWPSSLAHGTLQGARFADRTSALAACANDWLSRAQGPAPARPLQVLAWDASPEARGNRFSLAPSLRRLGDCVRSGFWPRRVAVLGLTEGAGGRVRGVVLAEPMYGSLPPVRTPEPWVLEEDGKTGEAWLTLWPETV